MTPSTWNNNNISTNHQSSSFWVCYRFKKKNIFAELNDCCVIWPLKLNDFFFRSILDNWHIHLNGQFQWYMFTMNLTALHNVLKVIATSTFPSFLFALPLHTYVYTLTIFRFWIHFHFSRVWAKYICLNELQKHMKCKLFKN